MSSQYRTTEKHGAAAINRSKSGVRGATSGNKHVVTGKKGQRDAGDQKGMVRKSLRGPY